MIITFLLLLCYSLLVTCYEKLVTLLLCCLFSLKSFCWGSKCYCWKNSTLFVNSISWLTSYDSLKFHILNAVFSKFNAAIELQMWVVKIVQPEVMELPNTVSEWKKKNTTWEDNSSLKIYRFSYHQWYMSHWSKILTEIFSSFQANSKEET